MSAAEGDAGSLLERLLEEAEAYGGGQTAAPDAAPAPSTASAPPGTGAERGADLSSLLGLIGPLLSGGHGQGRRTSDRHTALLKALKPYLAPQRRSAVDTLLTVSGLWDSLSGLGIGLPAPADRPAAGARPADSASVSAEAPSEAPSQTGGGDR